MALLRSSASNRHEEAAMANWSLTFVRYKLSPLDRVGFFLTLLFALPILLLSHT